MSRRDEIFASIPTSYRGVRHFALVNLMALAALVPALSLVRAPTWIDLAVVPVAFLLLSLGEWQLHRDVLHRRVPGLGVIYERHALTHHVAFHHDSMEAPSSREWRWVLFPMPALLGVMLALAPLGALARFLLGATAGWIFFATGIGFFLLYEWCHLVYHLPPSTWLGRRRSVAWLRRHHQRHHDPALARRYNFNITFPIWDWLRGTMAPPET